MKIVFISNYLNHHQEPLSDELYRLTGGNYWFIATAPMQKERRELGYKDIEAAYLIKCYGQSYPNAKIADLIDKADAVIIGSAPDSFIRKRNRQKKLVFKYSERIYKKEPGVLKLLAHRIRFKLNYDLNPNCYLLCASAFAAQDYKRIGCFKKRMYKWGYFSSVPALDMELIISSRKKNSDRIKLLWVGRFLGWKHPELAINLATKLLEANIDFELNMFGNGPMIAEINTQIKEHSLSKRVHLKGAAPNDDIVKAMRSHDIFLFTSDRNEGWGVVANEAMSNGCVVVASDEIGCVPYLITHLQTGIIFKSGDVIDLFNKVNYLASNRLILKGIALKAYDAMRNIWSPEKAAESLMILTKSIIDSEQINAVTGPCSKV